MVARCSIALLAVLAASPAIAGCGSSDDVLSSEAIAQAADKTTDKGASRVAIDQTITLPGQSPIKMSGSGVVDPKGVRGRLKFDLSKIPGLPNNIGSDATQEIIFERFTMYIRSPVFASSLPKGKRWLSIDLGEAGKAAGIDLAAISQGGQDPTQALSYLKAASGDVKRVGEETVRGTKTTHYTATVDFRRYPGTVPEKERASVRKTIDQLIKLSGSNTAPMEVWIGEDGVVRRLKQTIRTLVAPGTRGTIDQRVELYDFGAQVDLDVPPADEVQDSTDLAAQGVRDLTK